MFMSCKTHLSDLISDKPADIHIFAITNTKKKPIVLLTTENFSEMFSKVTFLKLVNSVHALCRYMHHICGTWGFFFFFIFWCTQLAPLSVASSFSGWQVSHKRSRGWRSWTASAPLNERPHKIAKFVKFVFSWFLFSFIFGPKGDRSVRWVSFVISVRVFLLRV